MGAAIAYYSLFSIGPLLVIVISIAGLVFGPEAVRGAISAQIAGLMGDEAARAVSEMLAHANRPQTGGLAALVSAGVLLFGASTVLAEMQSALDRIWRVPERAKQSGWWTWIRSRLLTFGMVLALAFVMIVSLVMSAALSALGKWWGALLGSWEAVAHALDLTVSFVLLTAVFAMIYKLMPRASIRWRDVWVGAAVTSLLFAIGKWLIGLYLGKSDVGSSFGAFGSVALLMVWIYYSAQIFLFGAEFTWVYAHQHGSRRTEARPPTLARLEDAAAEGEVALPGTCTPATTTPAMAREAPQEAPRVPLAHRPELAVAAAFGAGALVRLAARFLLRRRNGGAHSRIAHSG